jgi:hypothetical protein
MSTIRETVQTSLNQSGNGRYMSYAEPVIAALEAREQAAVDIVREAARADGLNPRRVTDVLVEAGLIEPAPEPIVTEAGDNSGVVAMVGEIRQTVERLAQFARQHGFRG